MAYVLIGIIGLLKFLGGMPLPMQNDMKKWISTRGPLVACFNVYQDFDAYPNSGKDVYHHVTGDFRGGALCKYCWI